MDNTCDTCIHGTRLYADGYIYADWSGHYTNDINILPFQPDPTLFWTYVECAKNKKKLLFINLMNDCSIHTTNQHITRKRG